MERRRVVITGLGTVNPTGNTAAESWAAVKEGQCGIRAITRYDTSNMKVKLAGEIQGLDTGALLGKRESKKMDRFTQLALIAADECMRDAALDREAEEPGRCGVIFSSGIGGFETVGEAHRRGSERGYDAVSPFVIPMIISNMAAGHMAIRYGFQGMCSCVVTACAGGTNAVGDAFRHIRDGYAEVMLCGGAEAAIVPLAMGGFTAMKALCEGTDPRRASIPFDAERSGFVMGEGAGALLLEELDHAQKRGAQIYAEVIGYGANCDAYHITAPAPNGAGGAVCMAQALSDAGIAPETVDYINAHGTSTPLNDAGETAAIRTVFGAHADKLMVSSTKSMTGHLLGAAGAVEAIFTALALKEGFVPATMGYQVPDPACDLDIVPNQGRQADIRTALSNSLGFGGHNAAIVLKKWEG
ncbi:beta-ketoacyl-[acyl-carrier-protein] synthase II [Pseudoflavonifractor sp. 60]|uniref:beta-ketoacyl-ACP synthase II n=1 Tax=Pseudoflavonifractor sp. 60 TaxID=2304576 RepID=UPI00136AA44A|nr:beta-ketoacyl-ACP synthase II [Pseudoflavonifractor sp. 60]NBI68300.1 beta-ketoacyl-[acyl-carrier-protein] synthase II [Pseudoflavonifractor sp. 60]